MKIFAAIDVGSYELSMKLFEFSGKNEMKEIDLVRHSIDLGTDSYGTGKISQEKVDDLCRVLNEFHKIMDSYHADDYKAYGTSAIRETENTMILLDQIHQRTGLQLSVLSNSEQRFLDYKSVASKGTAFNKIIDSGTAILDIGGGSIQISLFDKDSLVTTQNLRLGVLRLQESIKRLDARPEQVENLLDEIAESQIAVFKKLYLKDREIENIILVDDYLAPIMYKGVEGVMAPSEYVTEKQFDELLNALRHRSAFERAQKFDVSTEQANLMLYSAILLKQMLHSMSASKIWIPGVTLCDGIAYEYAENNKLVTTPHNFEQDIIASAHNISKRYQGNRKRAETLEQISLTIFDSMKKIHGMGKRERLLLQIASILHDCGKYISFTNLGECSYNIIMSTEIIGLSHQEREIVANVVKYNYNDFEYYDTVYSGIMTDKTVYLKIAKLTAILKIANGLDRSHKQKFKDVKMALKDKDLIITVGTNTDITLEKGLFSERAAFFEEVFSVKPVIRQRRQ